MTESEWLASNDPASMMDFVLVHRTAVGVWPEGYIGYFHTSDRKLKLFCGACCPGFTDYWNEIAGIQSVQWGLDQVINNPCKKCIQSPAAKASLIRHVFGNPFRPAWSVRCGRCKGKRGWHDALTGDGKRFDRSGRSYLPGNRPHIPADVERLAEALYSGEDCAFALHDALLEAGMEEMAGHFRVDTCPSTSIEVVKAVAKSNWHPRGCFALDAILGKE